MIARILEADRPSELDFGQDISPYMAVVGAVARDLCPTENVAFDEYLVFVRRPLRHRHVREEIARVPRRRDHVKGGAYFDIADCEPVSHLRASPPLLLQRLT